MKKLLVLLLLLTVLLSGCISGLTTVEIDTGQRECKKTTSGAAIGELFGVDIIGMIDKMCDTKCKQEGYSYKQWKCSEADTFVCVCNREGIGIPQKTATTTITTTTTPILSACPFEEQLKELITVMANLTWDDDDFRMPYGNVSQFFTGEDVEKVQGYRFGHGENYICVFPPEKDIFDKPVMLEISCRKGSKEKENLNYLYCGKVGYSSRLLIGKDIINPEGVIEEKIRVVVSEIVLDSRDFDVVEIKCEKVSCDE